MKRLAILTAMLAGRAWAEPALPDTPFFRELMAKNATLANDALNFCYLVGIEGEENCRAEMFDTAGSLNQIRLEAAVKCVEKSGMQYRSHLERYIKRSDKNQSWVGEQDPDTRKYHLTPMKHSKTGEEHYYFYSSPDRYEAGLKGREIAVQALKAKFEGNSSTDKISSSLTVKTEVEALLAKLAADGNITIEDSKTKTALTPEMIGEAQKLGERWGQENPDMMPGIEPHGYCVSGGKCKDGVAEFSEDQLSVQMWRKLENPKPEVKEIAKEPDLPPDPFGPFTSETATGGIKTDSEKDKEKERDKDKEKDKDTGKPKKTNSTLLAPGEYDNYMMSDCLSHEETKLLKETGSTTTDPEAQKEQDKIEEAKAKLQTGYCDELVLGREFCTFWENEQHKTKEEGADEKAKTEYEQALEAFHKFGTCNEMILGWEFCKAAKDELNSHKPQDPFEQPAIENSQPVVTPMDGWEPPTACEKDEFGMCI